MGKQKYIFGITITTVILLFIGVSIIASNSGLVFQKIPSDSKIIFLSDGWVDELGNDEPLPISLDYKNGTKYSYSVVLPDDGVDVYNQMLFFSVKYMNLNIYLDDEFLASALVKPDGQENSIGKMFKMIPLPENFAGRTLRVDAELVLGKEASYEINIPLIGSESDIVFHLLDEDLWSLIICIVSVWFSILLILLGMFKMDETHLNCFAKFGMFTFLFSLFCLFNLDMVRIFVGNSYLAYFFEFLLLALFPIPFVSAISDKCTPKFQKILKIVTALLYINLFAQVFLHFLTPLELRNTNVLTNGFLVIGIIVLIISLIKGYKGEKWIIASTIAIFVGALIDLFLYTFTDFPDTEIINIGVLIFMMVQLFYFMRSYFEYYKKYLKAEFYEHVAYFDTMTDVKNRSAFEKKLVELNGDLKKIRSLWCVVADINYLKKTNDMLGHAAGDTLIKSAADLLKTITHNEDALFRTGGDEFVILLVNKTKNEIMESISQLTASILEYNNQHKMNLSIALGYASLNDDDATVENIVARADALMYKNKLLVHNPSSM